MDVAAGTCLISGSSRKEQLFTDETELKESDSDAVESQENLRSILV